MYSQNNEEEIILNHFKERTGTFLDLGAYDGVSLSNTRALSERGWSGYCVEPIPEIFERLKANYSDNDKVKCMQFAMGEKNGTFPIYKNDTYYSTLSVEETKRWVSTLDIKYQVDTVPVKTFESFYQENPVKFDFISIDCEGVDYEILTQIDLNKVGCDLICVEHNSKETHKYIDYIAGFGFDVVHINMENLIMKRK